MHAPALALSGQARDIQGRTGKPWFDEAEQRDSIRVKRRLAFAGQAFLSPSVRMVAEISDVDDSDEAMLGRSRERQVANLYYVI